MAATLDAINIRTAFPIITCSCHQHQKQKKIKKSYSVIRATGVWSPLQNPLLLPTMRPCITPVILILRFVTMNENMFLVNPASKLRIIKKKKIMFSFLLLVSCESQQMRVLPPTSQLTSTLPPATARKPRGVGIKEQMTYCSDDRPGVMASKKATFSFC